MISSPDPTPAAFFNRCNVAPWILGSREFQDHPRPVEIDGVRLADRRLFERLATLPSPEQRGEVFHDYVSVKFRLHEWSEHQAGARSSLRSSYLRYLRNWGADSNGLAGALLKSWVESRFGLLATYHAGRLDTDPAAQARYWQDRMHGAAQTVGALMQLDLLYTFCQDELARRSPDERWCTLYRGTHDPEEYALRADPGSPAGTACVRLNNLSSFTADPEVAWEFGSSVWEVQVPLAKVIFFSGLLPRHLLQGESEHLVLGGEYRVRPLRY